MPHARITITAAAALIGVLVVAGALSRDPVPLAPPGMIWIPAGSFVMGSDSAYPEEALEREVNVHGFWLDAHEVTNRQFLRFVKETGYITVAQRVPTAAGNPGVAPSLLRAGSLVFVPPDPRARPEDGFWWRWVPGACWNHPEGPASTIDSRLDHPVVHVTIDDARAYAAWAGKRLPTEEEWEYAAVSGRRKNAAAPGASRPPSSGRTANTYQGDFPVYDSGADGYTGAAPVGSFPADAHGVYDLIGNVWELCDTRFLTSADTCAARIDRDTGGESCIPPGTSAVTDAVASMDEVVQWVAKGGSFLCAQEYCRRDRPSARTPIAADTSLSHTGFRCVK